MKPWNKTVPDLASLRYPKIIQPKIDGIHCIYWDGEIYSAAKKPLPNGFVTNKLRLALRERLQDRYMLFGELMAYPKAPYYETSSAIMSDFKEPLHFQLLLYDCLTVEDNSIRIYQTYSDRRNVLAKLFPVGAQYEHIDPRTCFGHTCLSATEALHCVTLCHPIR